MSRSSAPRCDRLRRGFVALAEPKVHPNRSIVKPRLGPCASFRANSDHVETSPLVPAEAGTQGHTISAVPGQRLNPPIAAKVGAGLNDLAQCSSPRHRQYCIQSVTFRLQFGRVLVRILRQRRPDLVVGLVPRRSRWESSSRSPLIPSCNPFGTFNPSSGDVGMLVPRTRCAGAECF